MPAQSPNARPGTPDARRLRLGRALRLGQNRDFARVRQQGQRLAQGCLIANWNRLPDGDLAQARRRHEPQNRRRGGTQPRAATAPRKFPAASA